MAKNSNFIKDILGSLFGGNDPEQIKKRALKNIAKNLSKTRYHYHKNGNEVDGSLAACFYEIYKVISPAQLMFQPMTPNQLKKLVLDYTMTSHQLELIEQLSEAGINEAAKKASSIKVLTENVKEKLDEFSSEYSRDKIVQLDRLYTKLVLFSNFCKFDYYFLLKKFDSQLKEREFNVHPKFMTINGTYVLEDLKNFVDVAWSLPLDDDWEDLIKLLRQAKGVEPVTLAAWKKVLARLRVHKEKRIFEMLIQLISENPSYRDEYSLKEMSVVDDYISEVKKNANESIAKLKAKQTAGKVESYLKQIFGSTDVDRLKYYNESGSSPFERKNLGSFCYAEPLAYLKSFLINYVKKDVRELSDIVIIRGEWSSQQLAAPMSEAFHQIGTIADEIIKLDNSVNETVDLGLKMKTHLPRADRDKESRNIIEGTLDYVNDTAGKIILNAIKLFVIYDKNLKMVLEDCVKPKQDVVRNWKDLDRFAEGKLKDMCIEVYKKIYAMVALLQQYPVKVKDSGDE